MYKGMIVDDAAVMRMRLKDILSPFFEIVAEAENGEEAIRNYDAEKPDFVTLDITMPKMDGIAVLEQLIAKYPDVKVVIVSAVGQKQLVFKALKMGAKDFIIKPFEKDRVLKSIDRLFNSDS